MGKYYTKKFCVKRCSTAISLLEECEAGAENFINPKNEDNIALENFKLLDELDTEVQEIKSAITKSKESIESVEFKDVN